MGLPRVLYDLFCITAEIADGRVNLPQRNLHISSVTQREIESCNLKLPAALFHLRKKGKFFIVTAGHVSLCKLLILPEFFPCCWLERNLHLR